MTDLVDSFDDSHAITLANSTAGGDGRVLRPGDIIGGSYRLKSLLGRGGMGYVFCAEHISLKLDYALKMLAPEQLNDVSRRRFEIEGRAIANLDHTNIVKVHNMGLDSGDCPFYVMDLLSGKSLADCVHDGEKFALLDLVDIFTQIASGLGYAHSKGIVHRDIKPSNIILINDDKRGRRAKIVDFGIAKLLPSADLHTQSQTATGEVFGSPYYMSPEQSMGKNVDHCSDMYSLGCTLFEALTGYPPFRGENPLQTILMHQNAPVPSVVEALPAKKIPTGVDMLLQKMMAKRPADRYQSMQQLIHDLQRLAEGKAVGGSQSQVFSNALTDGVALSEEGDERSESPAGSGRKVLIGVALLSLTLAAVAAVLFLRVPQNSIATGTQTTKATPVKIINPDIGTLSGGSDYDSMTAKAKAEASDESDAIIDSVSYSKSLQEVQKEKNDVAAVQAIFDRSGPIVSRKVTRPDGRRVRRFSFPKHSIGTIVPGLDSEHSRVEAVGQQDLPDRELVLNIGNKPNHILFLTPSIFEKVGPSEFTTVFLIGRQENRDAIKKLNIPSEGEGAEKILGTMSHWTNLSQIFLRKLYVTPKMWTALNNCRLLNFLEINDCRDVYPEILNQPLIFRLRALILEEFPEFRPVLKKLKDSPNLVVVRLFKCGAKPEDIKLLAPIPHCNGLHIEEEDLTPFIPAIVAVPNLQEIAIGGPKLNAAQIHQLTVCPHITHVTMRLELYSKAEQEELKMHEPKLVFASL